MNAFDISVNSDQFVFKLKRALLSFFRLSLVLLDEMLLSISWTKSYFFKNERVSTWVAIYWANDCMDSDVTISYNFLTSYSLSSEFEVELTSKTQMLVFERITRFHDCFLINYK